LYAAWRGVKNLNPSGYSQMNLSFPNKKICYNIPALPIEAFAGADFSVL